APEDRGPLKLLSAIHEQRGDVQALAGLLERERHIASAQGSQEDELALELRLAQLESGPLGLKQQALERLAKLLATPFGAAAATEALVRYAHGHDSLALDAARALERDARARGDTAALLSALELQRRAVTNDARAVLFKELGELHRSR